MTSAAIYRYVWANNAKRATLHGRTCRILCRGRMNSVAVEFVDNGETEVVSFRALRRLSDQQGPAR